MLQAGELKRGRMSRNPWRVRKALDELCWLSAHMSDVWERAASEDERRWVLHAADTLERLIIAGEAVATGYEDPRVRRTARKRPVVSDREAEFSWQYGRYRNG